jgi:peptidoglycan/xylan/chitin deacetylase (PgdA/CDA1 family)/ubiquinone/menaquinone biosynthesis C-methylase UbiE
MGKTDPVVPVRVTVFPLSIALLAGIAAIQISVVLFFVLPSRAIVPLAVFIILCLVAPFFPGLWFFMPVITHGAKQKNAVALTFDDGPSPETTPLLLDLLEKYGLHATHFVIGSKAASYPDLIKGILSQGHDLGNHSMTHDVFLMLKSSKVLGEEILQCQRVLAGYGVRPLMFRPPVGIVNPRLWPELLEQGLSCITFSRRGRDYGNRRIQGIARRILKQVKAGDVIMLHDCAPKTKGQINLWLQEIEEVITVVQAKGLQIIPLSALIGRPVMEPVGEGHSSNPAAAFYDAIAGSYDDEQQGTLIAISRKPEHDTVTKRLHDFVRPSDSILEIGPGTGMYTLELARLAQEVTAVDVSGRMLNVLEHKAVSEHLTNIKYVRGDSQEIFLDNELNHRFNHICAFSSLEYVPDISALIQRLSQHLEPQGILYFTTAHRTFFRFWTQIGNAMRQGIWLHARSIPEIRKALLQAGLTPVVIQTHGLNLGFNNRVFLGGVLLEVMAKKN